MCLPVDIYFLTTKPPFADDFFIEVMGVLSTCQAAVLNFVHFSLLRSTLHSFLSGSFYSQTVTYRSMLWIKVEYIVTCLGQEESILNKVPFILLSPLTFVFFSISNPVKWQNLPGKWQDFNSLEFLNNC